MKKIYLLSASILMSISCLAQEDEVIPDTTRMNAGKTEVIFIHHRKAYEAERDAAFSIEDGDTIYKNKKRNGEPHWAGIDMGVMMLMNSNFEDKFKDNPYWNNDAARSMVTNINFMEHKFNIAKEYFGITTGLGLTFASIGFKDDYVLMNSPDTLFAEMDSVYSYSVNKLKASYLTVPLLLEFNTNKKARKSFYLAAGIVAGVRLGSKVKRYGEFDDKRFSEKEKGKFGLNPFKLDGLVRLGYNDWGAFASYSLLPLFDTDKTVGVYPLTFGLSFNL